MNQLKQLIKYSFDISLRNWPTLLLFHIAYKSVSYSMMYSITTDLLVLILKAAGISYVSAENFYLVLTNPVSLFLCVCMILLAAFFVFFETVALYIYCEEGWRQNRLSIITLGKRTLLQCQKLLHVKNILSFLGFLLTTLLTFLPFSPYILQGLRIPEFIMEFIAQHSFPLYGIAVLAANIICFLFLFSLPHTLFHDKSIGEAWKEGLHLLKKRKLTTLFRLLWAFILLGIAMAIVLGLGILWLVIYTKTFETHSEAVDIFILYFKRSVPAAILFLGLSTTIWFFSLLIVLFHQYREEIRPVSVPKVKTPLYLLKQGAMLISAFIILLMFSESEIGGSFLYQTYYEPKVVAHRAGAVFAPENTMAALDNAIATGVDMVEIDVQQLKDGSLILLHDDNFNRTTGQNKNVWEVDYSEVQTYDAGSWFSEKFANEPVPTLEDILKRAKGKIQVMIELKLTGHEENLVEQVISLIEKYDMLEESNIGSLNLEVLKEVNTINPMIETVYITPLIYSGQYNLDFIDAFSIETTYMTREMVSTMHSQKKEVYGWTANSKEAILKNLRCQVDGIVTDNPPLVRKYIMQTWDNRLADYLVKLFFE